LSGLRIDGECNVQMHRDVFKALAQGSYDWLNLKADVQCFETVLLPL
jgi:hypothetical protein